MKKFNFFVLCLLTIVLVVSCSGKGGKSEKDIAEGLKTEMLLFSAFDGNDYEIYLLNPDVNREGEEEKAEADTDKGTTKVTDDAESTPQYEILQITDNDTNDFYPNARGMRLAWVCDDGAGGELCYANLYDKKFKQVTKLENGGSLGRDVRDSFFFKLLENQKVLARTYSDLNMRSDSMNMMIYDPNDEAFNSIHSTGILGLEPMPLKEGEPEPRFAEVSLNLGTSLSNGNGFLHAGYRMPDVVNMTYGDETSGNFLFDESLRTSKIDFGEVTWKQFINDANNIYVFLHRTDDTEEFGVIDFSTKSYKKITNLLGDLKICSSSGLNDLSEKNGIVFISYSDDAAYMYSYKSDTAELKQIAFPFSNANVNTRLQCASSKDSMKAISYYESYVDDGSNNSTKYQYIDIFNFADNSRKNIFNMAQSEESTDESGNTIFTSSDYLRTSNNLDAIAVKILSKYNSGTNQETKTELRFIDVNGNTIGSYKDINIFNGSFMGNSGKFYFRSNEGDYFVCSVDGSSTIEDLPFRVNDDWGDFVLLKEEKCLKDSCAWYDHDINNYKLYDGLSDIEIEIPNNKKVLLGTNIVKLTKKEYEKWKETIANAEFTKTLAPVSDSPIVYLSTDGNVEISSSYVFDLPRVNSIRTKLYSRKENADFTAKLIYKDKEIPIEIEGDQLPYGYLENLLWPSIKLAHVILNNENIDFGDSNMLEATIEVSDGTSTSTKDILLVAKKTPPRIEFSNTYLNCNVNTDCVLIVYVSDEDGGNTLLSWNRDDMILSSEHSPSDMNRERYKIVIDSSSPQDLAIEFTATDDEGEIVSEIVNVVINESGTIPSEDEAYIEVKDKSRGTILNDGDTMNCSSVDDCSVEVKAFGFVGSPDSSYCPTRHANPDVDPDMYCHNSYWTSASFNDYYLRTFYFQTNGTYSIIVDDGTNNITHTVKVVGLPEPELKIYSDIDGNNLLPNQDLKRCKFEHGTECIVYVHVENYNIRNGGVLNFHKEMGAEGVNIEPFGAITRWKVTFYSTVKGTFKLEKGNDVIAEKAFRVTNLIFYEPWKGEMLYKIEP